MILVFVIMFMVMPEIIQDTVLCQIYRSTCDTVIMYLYF